MASRWDPLVSQSRFSTPSLFGRGFSSASAQAQVMPAAAPTFLVPTSEPLWVPAAYVSGDHPSPAPAPSAPSGWSTAVQIPVFHGQLLCDWAPSRTPRLGEATTSVPTLPKGTLLLLMGGRMATS